MTDQPKIEYHKMDMGFAFPASNCKLDSELVATYLKAVEETSPLYQGTGLVPPMAIATCAMSALSGSVSFPPGTIHVSQELEFVGTACLGDTVTCQARVSRKQDRGKLHLMTIDLGVFNQEQKKVMAGKVGFILPEQTEDSEL